MLILDINLQDNINYQDIIEVKQEKIFTDYDNEIYTENIIFLNGKKYFYDYL